MAELNGIRDEIRDLAREYTEISETLYKALRLNSYERIYLLPHLSDEALIACVDQCLKHCHIPLKATYEEALQMRLVPELLNRLRRKFPLESN